MSIGLSNRLRAIADFVSPGSIVADVGTDHGYLPVYLVLSGISERAIASDISDGSLAAARRSVSKYGVADAVSIVHAPGLTGVEASEVDTVVIAGMGGETIAKILSEASWIRDGKTLILQPQSKLEELLFFLAQSGYMVLDACIALDDGKYYVVLKACLSEADKAKACMSNFDLLLLLANKNDPHFAGYLNKQIASAKCAVEGLRASKSLEYERKELWLKSLTKLSRSGLS